MKIEPVQHLECIAAELKSYSDQGQHRRIPGPSAGRAYELGLEVEMCLAALASRVAEDEEQQK